MQSRLTLGARGGVAIAVLVASGCGAAPVRSGRPSSTLPAAPPSAAVTARPPGSTTSTSRRPVLTSPTIRPLLASRSPAPLEPLVHPALPGEGTWLPATGSFTAGSYAIYTTQLRPAPLCPAAGVAWIDTRRTRLSLYAGISEPYGIWPEQGYVRAAQLPYLLAAFNSGFKIYAYRTGWFDQGRTAEPLQPGAASLVIFKNGTATVGAWGREVTLTPAVEAVRQNLTLLVDNGAPAATSPVVRDWGATLHGVMQTWRSGLGVDRAGDLVYVGGPQLDPYRLARLLVAAGAVRAMELDINPEWVSFATYAHNGGIVSSAANLLAAMHFSPTHYLQPASRDFIGVFSR